MNAAIEVSHLSKRFRRFSKIRPLTLQEAALQGFRRVRPEAYFWALQDISFSVQPGCMLGLIGANGAGKSTLLRLAGGVGRAERGSIRINGRVSALIDLGAGFHGDLTGRENIFINGIISGLTRREVARRLDEIVAFSELEEFIDSPLRTYSSGMQMRLAFAVAAHVDPQVLLVDEVLAVGDLAFQRKCIERIEQFKNAGCAILLVSHDTGLVSRICDEALWLRGGRMVELGPAERVVSGYVQEMQAETRQRTPAAQPGERTAFGTELRLNDTRFGSQEMTITAVRLLDGLGQPLGEFTSGGSLLVELEYGGAAGLPGPLAGVTLTRADGTVVYDVATAVGQIPPAGRLRHHIERLELAGGDYFCNVGLYRPDWAYAYDYHWQVYPLRVLPTGGGKGVLHTPHRWEVLEGR